MNCLDVRRCLLQNPAAGDKAMQRHLQDCVHCQVFASELHRQEALLQSALDVPVPSRLSERVILNSRLKRSRLQRYIPAAAVLLMIMAGIGRYMLPPHFTPAAWSEVVLAHVLNERETLERDGNVPVDQLRAALAGFGLALNNELGHIRYLDRCEMPGGKGLHVVIDTHELGLVTLILPPKGILVDGGQSKREGFVSALIQVGDTAVGIVTKHPEHMVPLNRWLRTELRSI